ncbi:uncharacterized protein BKA78DRAFT_300533 [Phyllosticta capitalensis]|uniref:uncharacterized protein n=1 Tax=Phyllosticta capitalensis TaxID=121624 RepID=UPI003132376D
MGGERIRLTSFQALPVLDGLRFIESVVGWFETEEDGPLMVVGTTLTRSQGSARIIELVVQWFETGGKRLAFGTCSFKDLDGPFDITWPNLSPVALLSAASSQGMTSGSTEGVGNIAARHWAKWTNNAMRLTPAMAIVDREIDNLRGLQSKSAGRRYVDTYNCEYDISELEHVQRTMLCYSQNVFLFHVDTTADATGISSRHWAKWARVAMRSTPARVLAVIHAQKFKDDQAKCIGRQRLESWKFDQEVIQLGHIEVAMDDMDSAVAEDLVYVTASPGLQPLLHPLSSTTTMKKPQSATVAAPRTPRLARVSATTTSTSGSMQVSPKLATDAPLLTRIKSESDAVVAARSTSDYEDDTDDTTTWRQTRRAGRPHTTALAPAAPFAPVPASPPRVRAPTSQRAAARSALNASSFKKSMPPDVLRCVINGTLPRVFANHSLPAATKFISLTNEEMRISPVRIGGKLYLINDDGFKPSRDQLSDLSGDGRARRLGSRCCISLTNEEVRVSPIRIDGRLVRQQPTLRAQYLVDDDAFSSCDVSNALRGWNDLQWRPWRRCGEEGDGVGILPLSRLDRGKPGGNFAVELVETGKELGGMMLGGSDRRAPPINDFDVVEFCEAVQERKANNDQVRAIASFTFSRTPESCVRSPLMKLVDAVCRSPDSCHKSGQGATSNFSTTLIWPLLVKIASSKSASTSRAPGPKRSSTQSSPNCSPLSTTYIYTTNTTATFDDDTTHSTVPVDDADEQPSFERPTTDHAYPLDLNAFRDLVGLVPIRTAYRSPSVQSLSPIRTVYRSPSVQEERYDRYLPPSLVSVHPTLSAAAAHLFAVLLAHPLENEPSKQALPVSDETSGGILVAALLDRNNANINGPAIPSYWELSYLVWDDSWGFYSERFCCSTIYQMLCALDPEVLLSIVDGTLPQRLEDETFAMETRYLRLTRQEQDEVQQPVIFGHYLVDRLGFPPSRRLMDDILATMRSRLFVVHQAGMPSFFSLSSADHQWEPFAHFKRYPSS